MTDLSKTSVVYTRDWKLPAIFILVSNLLGFLHLLPVFPQLLINSSCCVYIGVILSAKLRRSETGLVAAEKEKDSESIGHKEALRFPIFASMFLLGFYLIYKYISKDLINILLTFQFCLATIISTSSLLEGLIPFPQAMRKVITHVKPPKIIKSILEINDFDITQAILVCTVICSIPVMLYYVTKYWALNNIFGILFSIVALRNINLSSFKVGLILLWLLFFYDIFWVYGTDVMVTVAKNLDIPIKLLFPYLNEEGVEKFSMLGLGDIVIPGIFVGLCLKFDIDNSLKKLPKSTSNISLPYFNTCFIGYVAGICATFAAMYIFNHAQPALLFLVPSCTLSVILLSFIRGEFDLLKNYETEAADNKKEGEKSDEKVA